MKTFTVLLLPLYFILAAADPNPVTYCRKSNMPGELTLDCSNCNLTSVPADIPANVKTLILKNNHLGPLTGSPFINLTSLEYLDISLSYVTSFDEDAFVGLSSLKNLYISQDDTPTLPEGLFAPLVNLQYLRLGKVFIRNQPFPGTWINSMNPDLKHLDLSVPLNYVFTKDFARFSSLESLIITGNGCRLTKMKNDTFRVFSNSSIKTLEVKLCYLKDLSPDALTMFQNLETLNLACNYHRDLEFKKLFEAAKGLPSPSLQTLVVDGSGRKTINVLGPDIFDSPSFSHLRRLSLRSNKIYSIDLNFLKHIPELEHINLGFNSIMEMSPKDEDLAINMSVNLVNLMNVTTVDASYYGIVSGASYTFRNKYCRPDPVDTDGFFRKPPMYVSTPEGLKTGIRTIDYTQFDDHENFLTMNVPLSLNHVYVEHIGVTRDEFLGFKFNDNNILHIDFSKNQVRTISGPLIGLNNLQAFDLNSCGLIKIVPEALKYMYTLTSLRLSSNSLTSECLEFLRHIGNSSSLKILDLSYNLLHGIDSVDLFHLTSLEVLNLTNNHIIDINTDFLRNPNLKVLDISNCALTSLSEPVTLGLNSLHEQSAGVFQVDLRGNPWSCNCETLMFLKWMKTTEVHIIDKESLTCLHVSDNITVAIKSVDLDELESDCQKVSLATVVAVPSFLVLVSLLTTTLAFHYRWTLKWQFYLLRRKARMMVRSSSSSDDQLLSGMNDDRNYDAFVSHNHTSDYEWVQSALLPKVEETWNMKLCLGQRDFMVGMPIAENICEAIDNSRFTIIVVTPAFLQSGWCDFELHMALTRGRQNLIIVYKEEIDVSQTSKTLRTLMKSINYIEYSDNADGQAMFWQRLHEALTSKVDTSNFVA